MPSDATIRKGARLQQGGRVHRIKSAVVFTVEGAHDTYVVTVDPDDQSRASCTCQATGRCSHIIAACFELNLAGAVL